MEPSKIHELYKYNPDILVGLRNKSTGTMDGHMVIMPICDYTYNRIIEGKFNDVNITEEDLMPYRTTAKYKLYISILAVTPEFRHTGSIYLAIKEYFRRMLIWNEMGIEVTDVVANAYTEDGERIMQKAFGLMGMKHDIFTSKVVYSTGSFVQKKMFYYLWNKFIDINTRG